MINKRGDYGTFIIYTHIESRVFHAYFEPYLLQRMSGESLAQPLFMYHLDREGVFEGAVPLQFYCLCYLKYQSLGFSFPRFRQPIPLKGTHFCTLDCVSYFYTHIRNLVDVSLQHAV